MKYIKTYESLNEEQLKLDLGPEADPTDYEHPVKAPELKKMFTTAISKWIKEMTAKSKWKWLQGWKLKKIKGKPEGKKDGSRYWAYVIITGKSKYTGTKDLDFVAEFVNGKFWMRWSRNISFDDIWKDCKSLYMSLPDSKGMIAPGADYEYPPDEFDTKIEEDTYLSWLAFEDYLYSGELFKDCTEHYYEEWAKKHKKSNFFGF